MTVTQLIAHLRAVDPRLSEAEVIVRPLTNLDFEGLRVVRVVQGVSIVILEGDDD